MTYRLPFEPVLAAAVARCTTGTTDLADGSVVSVLAVVHEGVTYQVLVCSAVPPGASRACVVLGLADMGDWSTVGDVAYQVYLEAQTYVVPTEAGDGPGLLLAIMGQISERLTGSALDVGSDWTAYPAEPDGPHGTFQDPRDDRASSSQPPYWRGVQTFRVDIDQH